MPGTALGSGNMVEIRAPSWSKLQRRGANLENSAVVTGLEKVSFHSSPKERQCQRIALLLMLKLIMRIREYLIYSMHRYLLIYK